MTRSLSYFIVIYFLNTTTGILQPQHQKYIKVKDIHIHKNKSIIADEEKRVSPTNKELETRQIFAIVCP